MSNEYELYHHGILGMKWGIRKEEKYAARSEKLKRKTELVKLKTELDDAKRVRKLAKNKAAYEEESAKKTKESEEVAKTLLNKNESSKRTTSSKQEINSLSDDDLRKVLNRLDMEKRYSDLTTPKPSPEVSNGKKKFESFVKNAGLMAAGVTSAAAITGKTIEVINNSRKLKTVMNAAK